MKGSQQILPTFIQLQSLFIFHIHLLSLSPVITEDKVPSNTKQIMKKYFIIFIAIMLCTYGFANNASDARKILDKAAAKVNIKSGATANFTIKGGKINQAGTISIKGNKFNARTSNAIIWYNGKTQWIYNKKNEEVNVSTPSAQQQHTMNPYTFLRLYKSGYTLSMTNAASGYQIHMVGKGKSISEAYILIDKSYTVKQVKIKQKNVWTTINISNFKAHSISDAAFTFKAKDYPKAEIIDLR